MKLLAAGIALFLLSSAGAEAGLFSRKTKLPKPIDHPVVRPKVRDDHKPGKRAGQHPERFTRPDWGANWGQTLDLKRRHDIPDYLKQPE
jgi:hypothetical protein